MGDFCYLSFEIKFSLVMSSPGGTGMVNGEWVNKKQCSITIATLSKRTKIALTGVRSRLREYLASQLI